MSNEQVEEKVLVVPASLVISAMSKEAETLEGTCIFKDSIVDVMKVCDSSWSFKNREDVEEDCSFLQVVPYVILKCGDDIMFYRRGKRGGERRLTGKYSVGIGGHVCIDDVSETFMSTYFNGMTRELNEEIMIPGIMNRGSPYTLVLPNSMILDLSTEVGRVHLGMVYILPVQDQRVISIDAAVENIQFRTLSYLRSGELEFENWSKFCIEGVL